MIEILFFTNSSGVQKAQLTVDGVVVGKSLSIVPDAIEFDIDSAESIPLLGEYRLEDLPKGFGRIGLKFDHELTRFYLYLPSLENNKDIEVHILPYLPNWNNPYSPLDLITEFCRVVTEDYGDRILINHGSKLGPSLDTRFQFSLIDTEANIVALTKPIADQVLTIYNQAVTNLQARSRGHSLLTYFSFPKEIQSACEQYLLYFGDFLRDIGIDASVELKEEADRVLFSVTPKDQREALDRIRRVLEVYVELPSSSLTYSEDSEYRLQIQRLSANIMHLKGQLILAQAVLEAKDATIEAQRERLAGRVLLESMERRTEQSTDKEEFFDGTLAIKKYEGKGFDINLPKMFRALKDYFKKKE